MREMIQRLSVIIIKEFTQLKRDSILLRMLIIMPIIQVLIFGYAAILDIKNINSAVLDKDKSRQTRELIDSFKKSNYFNIKYYAETEKDIALLLEKEQIMMGIIIHPDFTRKMLQGNTAAVQILVDGTNSSAAGIISNYGASTVGDYSSRMLMQMKDMDESKIGSIQVDQRYMYNPSLNDQWFFLPGIFGMIILVIGMPMTAMAIVREKEGGTLEQLIVTPMRSIELIIGKVVPYTILILISSTGILLLSIYWFHIPLRGSLITLYLTVILFLLNCLGIGIFLSSISSTQQQAILTSFFINMPMILLSGFMFPIANMPPLFKAITYINPMAYFLICIRGVFLKGVGIFELSHELLAMLVIGLAIFIASSLTFKKRLD